MTAPRVVPVSCSCWAIPLHPCAFCGGAYAEQISSPSMCTMETVSSLTMRAGRPAIWTERRASLCEACSQRDITAYTRFRSRASAEMCTRSRRPRPVSPSKPAKPSKPHKPVLSRSARGSTSRVSGGRVSGGGTGVWANVVGTGRSKLAASIPVAINVANGVFFIDPTFVYPSKRAYALGNNQHQDAWYAKIMPMCKGLIS
jgi:hypothetical protein